MNTSIRVRSFGAALLAAALAVAGVQEAFSQSTPGGGTSSGPTASGTAGTSTSTATPTSYLTNSITRNIDAARAECASYDPVYRIDCLRQRLLDIARRIPRGPAYDDARRIISQAAGKLGRIQAGNIDRRAPRQRSRGNARLKESKTYVAIKRENLNKAMEQARQVIQEAETQLLRAAENSEKRANHYQQIAAAVGSTKVLLRSA